MKATWPIGLTIFFAVFISSVVGFVIWSTHQRSELVSSDYYDQEINYQQHIDAAARAAAAGLKPRLRYDHSTATLTLAFSPPDAVQSATGTVTLYRPSEAALDQTFAFAPGPDGIQTIPVSLSRGLWRVKADWYHDGLRHYAEEPMVVRP